MAVLARQTKAGCRFGLDAGPVRYIPCIQASMTSEVGDTKTAGTQYTAADGAGL